MTQLFPLLLLTVLLIGMMVVTRRNKQRVADADARRREHITTGTDVMTTSGLYGTVVSVNDDGTVLLAVAPGVEVRWSMVALRELDELPQQYRQPIAGEQPAEEAAEAPRVDGSGPS